MTAAVTPRLQPAREALIALPLSPAHPCTRCGTVRPRANLTTTGVELVCPECARAQHVRELRKLGVFLDP